MQAMWAPGVPGIIMVSSFPSCSSLSIFVDFINLIWMQWLCVGGEVAHLQLYRGLSPLGLAFLPLGRFAIIFPRAISHPRSAWRGWRGDSHLFISLTSSGPANEPVAPQQRASAPREARL